RDAGAPVYEAVERKARALLDGVPENKRTEVLERLVREYPNATVTRESLLPLARSQEKAGRWGAAAVAYRVFLERCREKDEHAVALAGLAGAYEHQHCWDAAKTSWQQLARDHGERYRSMAEEHLRQLANRPMAGPADDLGLPWRRSWQVTLEPGE